MKDQNQDQLATRDMDEPESQAQNTVSYLVVLAGDKPGRVIRLKRKHRYTTGRSRECDYFFDCDNISRSHASFELDMQAKTTIRDNGSTNGTFVNGKRIKEQVLANGDRICMGDVILRYSFQDSLEFDVQKELYDNATRDPLTGAFNKRYFQDVFDKDFSLHNRQNKPLSLMILDLDDFKRLNDTFGHVNGDIVLKSVAKEIMSCLRQEDIFTRFGGEEFVCLFRYTSHETAMTIAKKLVSLVRSLKFSANNVHFTTSATIGVATLVHQNYESPRAMLMDADHNLYQGKKEGKNRVIG